VSEPQFLFPTVVVPCFQTHPPLIGSPPSRPRSILLSPFPLPLYPIPMPSKRAPSSKNLHSLQRKKVAAAKAAVGAPAAAAASPPADGTVAMAAQQTMPEGETTFPSATTPVAPPPVDETEMVETESEILMEGRVGVPHIDFLGSSAPVLHSEVEASLARPGDAGVLTLANFINEHDAALMEKAAEPFNEENTALIFNT